MFAGFTHHDITLRYRCDYTHLAYKPSTPKHIQLIFQKMAMSDVVEPTLRIPIPDSLEVEQATIDLLAID